MPSAPCNGCRRSDQRKPHDHLGSEATRLRLGLSRGPRTGVWSRGAPATLPTTSSGRRRRSIVPTDGATWTLRARRGEEVEERAGDEPGDSHAEAHVGDLRGRLRVVVLLDRRRSGQAASGHCCLAWLLSDRAWTPKYDPTPSPTTPTAPTTSPHVLCELREPEIGLGSAWGGAAGADASATAGAGGTSSVASGCTVTCFVSPAAPIVTWVDQLACRGRWPRSGGRQDRPGCRCPTPRRRRRSRRAGRRGPESSRRPPAR